MRLPNDLLCMHKRIVETSYGLLMYQKCAQKARGRPKRRALALTLKAVTRPPICICYHLREDRSRYLWDLVACVLLRGVYERAPFVRVTLLAKPIQHRQRPQVPRSDTTCVVAARMRMLACAQGPSWQTREVSTSWYCSTCCHSNSFHVSTPSSSFRTQVRCLSLLLPVARFA
jgi:hypothetical protein